ncbi:hypothetical protein [Oceanicaulis alexandrii]|uniref:hypothetical protein n=1 Tax=Oceanicaulis alexandrii TaxID=153233 RepID=UPI002355F9A7|nr:hypothetical protein [Oceanicaulis alexandrii]
MTNTADLVETAATWLSAKPELQAFSAYFNAKQAGLKAAAKQVVDTFAAQLEQAPLAEAISLVRTLDEARRLFGAIPGFMPYPVAMAASRVCQRWEEEDAAAADPLVFRAGFEWNPDLFAQALERDPHHPAALRGRILDLLRRVSDAFHTVERGALSEPEPDVRAAMQALATLCEQLQAPDFTQAVLEELNLFQEVLAGLDAWRAAGQPGSFTAYMQAQGLDLNALPGFFA